MQDEIRKRAVIRSLEVIGGAAKKPPASLTDRYPDVDWHRIARMRGRLIHGYFGVDYGIVWDAATQKGPDLRRVLSEMLDEAPGGDR